MYSFSCYGDIFQIGRNKKISSLYGDGSEPYKKQTFKQYGDDMIDAKINFDIHRIQPILNSQYILAIYKYKDEYILELKNKFLKTIDILPMKNLGFFNSYISDPMLANILILENKIYTLDIENDEIILNEFEIDVK